MRYRLTVLTALLALGPAAARAQRLPTPRFEPRTASVTPRTTAATPRPSASGLRMAAGGLLGGAAGALAGAAIGVGLACNGANPEDDLCALSGIVTGGTLGEVTTLPLGIHLANRRQGSFILDLLASAGTAALGLSTAVALARSDTPPLGLAVAIATPFAQIWAVSALEKATSR